MKKVEEHVLAGAHSQRLTCAEQFVIKARITMRGFGPLKALPMVNGQEDFLIESAGMSARLDQEKTELPVAAGRGVIPA